MTLRAFLSPVVQTRVFQTCFASLPFLILGQLGLTPFCLLPFLGSGSISFGSSEGLLSLHMLPWFSCCLAHRQGSPSVQLKQALELEQKALPVFIVVPVVYGRITRGLGDHLWQELEALRQAAEEEMESMAQRLEAAELKMAEKDAQLTRWEQGSPEFHRG